jgi:hypothetical protein
MNIDLMINEYIERYEENDPYAFEASDDDDTSSVPAPNRTLTGIQNIQEFHHKMQYLYNTELARSQLFKNSFYKNIQRFIVNNYGTAMNVTMGEPYIHTKKFAVQYGTDLPVDHHRVPGWIPIVFHNAIMDFMFGVGSSDDTRHCLQRGIFVNKWTDVFMYMVKRLGMCVSRIEHVRYYPAMQDKKMRGMIQQFLYNADSHNTLKDLCRHFPSFPSLATASDFYKKQSAMIINYYKLQSRRMEDDARIRIAYLRQRLCRLLQNVESNVCPVCMDDLSGPMIVMGCCQSIYHCACVMASWELRYQHSDHAQCPYCRSNPILNSHTCFITNDVNEANGEAGQSSNQVAVHTIPPTWENQLVKHIYEIGASSVVNEPVRILLVIPKENYEKIDREMVNFNCYMRRICKMTTHATHSDDPMNAIDAIELPIPEPIRVDGAEPEYSDEARSYQVILNSASRPSSQPTSPTSQSRDASREPHQDSAQYTVGRKVHFINARTVPDEAEDPSGIYVYVISKYAMNTKNNIRRLYMQVQELIDNVRMNAIIQFSQLSMYQIPVTSNHYDNAKIPVYFLEHKRY